MDSLIWYTGIFRIKSGILESSQDSKRFRIMSKKIHSVRPLDVTYTVYVVNYIDSDKIITA